MKLMHRTTVTKQSGLTSASDAMNTLVKELVEAEVAAAMSSTNNEQQTSNNTEISSQNASQIQTLQTSMNVVDVSMSSLTDEIQTIKSNVAALEETTGSLSTSATATSQNVGALTQSLSALDATVEQNKAETNQKIETEITEQPNWTGRLFKRMHPYCTSVWANVSGSDVPSWIGSGCWINPAGLFDESPRYGFLLTAAHVIDQALNITSIWVLPAPDSITWVNLPLRRTTTNGLAKNVFEDITTDIAIVQLSDAITQEYDPSGDALYPMIHIGTATGNDESVSTGDPICMIGNPAGIDADSFSSGHIRDAHYIPPSGSYECIAHHTSSTGGNSGSPLFNSNNEIVGLHTHRRTDANEFFFGPNWITLQRVIKYLFMAPQRKNTTLYGRGYRLEPNLYKTYPHQATQFLGGSAQSIRITSTSGITPTPAWTTAYITSAIVYGLNGEIMFEITVGDQHGGRGLGTLQFIENVSSIDFHGIFISAAGETDLWTFPSEASILF